MRRLLAAAGMAAALHGLLFLAEGSWLYQGEQEETTLPRAVTIQLLETPSDPSPPAVNTPEAEPPPRPVRAVRPGVAFSSPASRPQVRRARISHAPPAPPRVLSPGPAPARMPRVPSPAGGKPHPAPKKVPLEGAGLPSGTGPEPSPDPGLPSPAGKTETALPLVEAVPLYRENPRPSYPRLARRRGYEGTVVLEVLVTEDGGVGELRVARTSGYHLLDTAALQAVEGWRFDPGRRGDRPVAMRVRIPVRFRLQ